MAIERANSFHLLLSDDELKLLKLLAEREGLNASDYLRMLIRTMPSTSAQVLQGMRLGAAIGGKIEEGKRLESHWDALRLLKSEQADKKKRKAK